nr:hypothetical protein [Pandoravirus belohorizontensis]
MPTQADERRGFALRPEIWWPGVLSLFSLFRSSTSTGSRYRPQRGLFFFDILILPCLSSFGTRPLLAVWRRSRVRAFARVRAHPLWRRGTARGGCRDRPSCLRFSADALFFAFPSLFFFPSVPADSPVWPRIGSPGGRKTTSTRIGGPASTWSLFFPALTKVEK